VAAAVVSFATPAAAEEFSFTFEGVFTGQPGQTLVIEEASVDADVVGSDCSAVYTADNDASVRAGTDLIIRSGDQQIEITGVEDAAGATVTSDGNLIIAETVEIAVRFGPAGRASLGGSLTLDCAIAAPPETTTTSTTVPDDAATTTTTTTAAPGTTVPGASPATTVVPTTTTPAETDATTTVPDQQISGPLPATGTSGNLAVAVLAGVCVAAGLALRSVRPAKGR
jgi:hypothetical protein